MTAAGIAEQRLIPPALIRRIVTSLAVARLVKTTRGNAGGVTLGRPAGEISLLEVVEAMEGPLALNACAIAPVNDPDACPFIASCAVHAAWIDARAMLVREMSEMTFDKLAARSAISPIALEGG